MTICKEVDCEKPVHGRGLCSTHYAQLRRSGRWTPRPLIEDEFWPLVDNSAGTDECWPWTGTLRPDGYGKLRGKRANRISWELANARSIPAGLVIRHTCDNPPCVNPAHLILGTDKQNVGDMIERGRAWW